MASLGMASYVTPLWCGFFLGLLLMSAQGQDGKLHTNLHMVPLDVVHGNNSTYEVFSFSLTFMDSLEFCKARSPGLDLAQYTPDDKVYINTVCDATVGMSCWVGGVSELGGRWEPYMGEDSVLCPAVSSGRAVSVPCTTEMYFVCLGHD